MEKYSVAWKKAQGHWVQDHKASNGDTIYKIHYLDNDTEYSMGEYFTAKSAREEMERIFGRSSVAARIGKMTSEKKKASSRENAKKGGRPLHTLRDDVKVGIYDAEYIARIYRDKIIVTIPHVKWIGNSGSYAESKESIRDASVVDRVIKEIEDDCETTAWQIIGKAIGNEWLMNME
jgi:hypothetical protein